MKKAYLVFSYLVFFVVSNPSVQVEALEAGALQKLLTLLASPQPMSVKKKVRPLHLVFVLLWQYFGAQINAGGYASVKERDSKTSCKHFNTLFGCR